MITLASIAKARHVYATVGTEAKMEIERDAVYWLLTHTDVNSATELRGISQDFVNDMPYEWCLETWEALKKGDVLFCLLKSTVDGALYLELDTPDDDTGTFTGWANKVA